MPVPESCRVAADPVTGAAQRRTLLGMTRTMIRLATAAVAVALGAATLGCGFISNVGNAVDNLSTVADLTEKLTQSAELTYTAEYTLVDGSGSATVVQQPPNAAFIGKDARFVLTSESMLMCTGAGAKATCQRSANTAGATSDQATYLTAVAGGGFINTPMAIAMMGAASIVPDVKIDKSTADVAGLASTCLRATDIGGEAASNEVNLNELTVCVADNGVLTTFSGVGTDGSMVGVKLASYSATVDASAFAPPKGAKVVDVDQVAVN